MEKGENELLSRSSHQSGDVKRGCALAKLFLPRTDNMTTSVIRSSSMSDDEVWRRCKENAKTRESKKLYGRADLTANDVVHSELSLDRDKPDHANIVGWSPTDKQERMASALTLATKSKFIEVADAPFVVSD